MCLHKVTLGKNLDNLAGRVQIVCGVGCTGLTTLAHLPTPLHIDARLRKLAPIIGINKQVAILNATFCFSSLLVHLACNFCDEIASWRKSKREKKKRNAGSTGPCMVRMGVHCRRTVILNKEVIILCELIAEKELMQGRGPDYSTETGDQMAKTKHMIPTSKKS